MFLHRKMCLMHEEDAVTTLELIISIIMCFGNSESIQGFYTTLRSCYCPVWWCLQNK